MSNFSDVSALQGQFDHFRETFEKGPVAQNPAAKGHEEATPQFELIAGDASDRKFYRYEHMGHKAICMEFPKWEGGYGGDPMSWLGMQQALSKMGLPVPTVLYVDENNRCIWTEDFGDQFLNHHLTTSVLDGADSRCAKTFQHYKGALDLLVEAQFPLNASPQHPAQSRYFDFEKLHYELQFFQKHFVSGFLGIDAASDFPDLNSEFIGLCQWLADRPRVLCHRDYHVRNVMVHNNQVKWIDFQDARMGPLTYDVVSLLRDSYVVIEENTRSTLAKYYLDKLNSRRHKLNLEKVESADFGVEFQHMGLQRNIKALGSFGYLAVEKGKPNYLKYVQQTLHLIVEQDKKNPQVELRKTYGSLFGFLDSLIAGKHSNHLQNRIKNPSDR
jgi:N-acetylmuramate 1-kinase